MASARRSKRSLGDLEAAPLLKIFFLDHFFLVSLSAKPQLRRFWEGTRSILLCFIGLATSGISLLGVSACIYLIYLTWLVTLGG